MSDWLFFRIIRGRPRLFAGAGVALLSFVLLFPLHHMAVRAVLAWDLGSVVFLILTAALFLADRDHDISADAEAQQEGEWSVFALTLIGAIMSFIAIFLFSASGAGSNAAHHASKAFYIGFVVVTLVLSWLMTQVTFAYRYAHEYYTRDWRTPGSEIERGIEFPHDKTPDYFDFVYFSFVLGMTFQVSDCNITLKKFRRLATLHGVIGFLFNTVILALSVNIAASAM